MKKITIEKVCILAGKIMLVSGAETYRVEDTMNRIAAAFDVENAQSYATPTGINFSTDMAEATYSLRILKRSTDLHKIAEVNKVSRRIAAGDFDIEEAYLALREVDTNNAMYPAWVLILIAAIASGCFSIMFGGSFEDFLPAFFAGGLGFMAMLGFERLVEIRFLSEFFGAFIVGIASIIFIQIGFGKALDMVIIGAVMPLVPGLHITNAVRDLMAGHLVSGVSKGVEALLTAFAIGAGVAVTFAFI
ncbi:threonine/serine exporter family protein [Oceanobacillus bengalensis]|uniref:Threonine/serine exporter n=1 Tax=Oceanobacillus bengalensis TaxID=1435466 RepID=A0A494YRL8_9BACI|nr:threonine/serine exporter family protein [Oceanobacillus bengalensis]RKQ11953.1 threonine/serine exporter [Oceanobacillus bengalensis]